MVFFYAYLVCEFDRRNEVSFVLKLKKNKEIKLELGFSRMVLEQIKLIKFYLRNPYQVKS